MLADSADDLVLDFAHASAGGLSLTLRRGPHLNQSYTDYDALAGHTIHITIAFTQAMPLRLSFCSFNPTRLVSTRARSVERFRQTGGLDRFGHLGAKEKPIRVALESGPTNRATRRNDLQLPHSQIPP
ncbi:hypothetical protein GCM10020227_06590 [Streptomyces flavovirens]